MQPIRPLQPWPIRVVVFDEHVSFDRLGVEPADAKRRTRDGRDRFAEKIDVFSRMTFVAINVLYESRKSGHLIPSPAGALYEDMVSKSSGIARPERLC